MFSLALLTLAAFGLSLLLTPWLRDWSICIGLLDRPDNKQYRELFTTPEAVEALKAGNPIPSGTVLTLVQYKAVLDAAGEPEKDANGRFK